MLDSPVRDERSLNDFTSSTSNTTTAQQMVVNSRRALQACQRDGAALWVAGESDARFVDE